MRTMFSFHQASKAPPWVTINILLDHQQHLYSTHNIIMHYTFSHVSFHISHLSYLQLDSLNPLRSTFVPYKLGREGLFFSENIGLSGWVHRASDLTKNMIKVSADRAAWLIIDIRLNMSVYHEIAAATHVALTITLCVCDGDALVWWIDLPTLIDMACSKPWSPIRSVYLNIMIGILTSGEVFVAH